MITQVLITPRAARQVRALAASQGLSGRFGLRVMLPGAGDAAPPPAPGDDERFLLSLVPAPEPDDVVLPRHGFDLCLPRHQAPELDGIRIDVGAADGATGFVVGRDRKPTLKPPPLDAATTDFLASGVDGVPPGPPDIVRRAVAALDRVRPLLQVDGGDAAIAGVRDGVAFVRFSGACSGCSALSVTVTSTVQETLCSAVPEIREVTVVE